MADELDPAAAPIARPRPRARPFSGSSSKAAPPTNPMRPEYTPQLSAAMPSKSENVRSGKRTAPDVSVTAVRAPGM